APTYPLPARRGERSRQKRSERLGWGPRHDVRTRQSPVELLHRETMLKTFRPEETLIAAQGVPCPSPDAHLTMRVDLSPQKSGERLESSASRLRRRRFAGLVARDVLAMR